MTGWFSNRVASEMVRTCSPGLTDYHMTDMIKPVVRGQVMVHTIRNLIFSDRTNLNSTTSVNLNLNPNLKL